MFQKNKNQEKWFIRGVFFSSLSLSNQHTIILLVIPLSLSVIFTQKFTTITKAVQMAIFYGSLGLLPYLYLPFYSCFKTAPYTWGDTCSINGFVHHILRKDFGTFKLGRLGFLCKFHSKINRFKTCSSTLIKKIWNTFFTSK
jgi:hypothetical protein